MSKTSGLSFPSDRCSNRIYDSSSNQIASNTTSRAVDDTRIQDPNQFSPLIEIPRLAVNLQPVVGGSTAITWNLDMGTAKPVFNFDTNAAFHDFERSLKRFTVTPTYEGGRPFVLVYSLVNWWRSPWSGHDDITQAERLHYAVYEQTDRSFRPISSDQLSKGCLRVFSILLNLDRGELVDKFQRSGIDDSRLPMSNLEELHTIIKEMGLEDADAKDLAQRFHEKQWEFCPVDMYIDMARHFDKEYIIPICQKQKINDKGGSATGIYLIEIQAEFVSADLKKSASKYNNKEDNFGYRYQFALKTFHDSNYELFYNERKAFNGLKNHEGMVGYLGEYSHYCYPSSSLSTPTSNAGSLRPTEKTWNILLEYGDLDLDEYFLERLPPVFPVEILRFWEDLFEVGDAIKGVHNFEYGKGELARAYYGWHADIKPDNILSVHGKFKLADPGFAYFVVKTDEIPMGEVLGGTETYGAPECHPSRRRSSNIVHQTIDIWSLACVFSIAATWVTLGYQGILQYAEFRKRASKDNSQQAQAGVDDSTDSNSSNDYFHNGHVVLSEVTRWHEALRISLRKTDTITSLVLDLVDNHMLLGDPMKRLSAEQLCTELRNILKKGKEEQSKLGMEVPQLITDALCQLDDLVPAKPPPKTPSEKASSNSHSRNAKSVRLEIPMMKTTHRSIYYKSQQDPTSPPLHTLDPMELTETLESQGVSNLLPHTDDKENPSSTARYRSMDKLSQMTSTRGQSMDETSPRNMSGASDQLKTLRAPPQNVFQAKQQLDKESKKGLFGRVKKVLGKEIKDKVLSSHFYNRDLVFLVDNAATMRQHWDEATMLLDILVKKAAGQDPDGPDLRFTLGNHELTREKKFAAFTEAMGHRDAVPTDSAATDIRVSLGKIFEKYLKNFEKAMTIIVLTDGLWQGVQDKDEVGERIVNFVKEVQYRTKNVMPRRVTIEFIQFGTDAEATTRLIHWDDHLKDRGIPDVIDTEPANGDVYKMLLGSLVENYDGGENGLVLVESPERLQDNTSSSASNISLPNRSAHTSPSSGDPFTPPARRATEMSQQTVERWNTVQNQRQTYPPSESSQRNQDQAWPR